MQGYASVMTDTPNTRRLALHACCGPCLLEPYDILSAEFSQTVVVYFNPNIHPAAEYERRRDTLRAYADAAGITVVELEYDPAVWLERVGPLARQGSERCRACYRLRLGEVARWAAENGFDSVSTTLSVSPYQDVGAISTEGTTAAECAGVQFIDRDFRDRYTEATRRSREAQMYRQNYCGCVLSEVEARQQRASRKAAKEQKDDRTGG